MMDKINHIFVFMNKMYTLRHSLNYLPYLVDHQEVFDEMTASQDNVSCLPDGVGQYVHHFLSDDPRVGPLIL